MADDIERALLLDDRSYDEIEPSSRGGRTWKSIMGACLLGTAAISGLALNNHKQNLASSHDSAANTDLRAADNINFEPFTSASDSDGWLIYKVAFAGKDDEIIKIMDFMTYHSGGTDCEAVNLGCQGFKLTCNYAQKQIHYVVAPALVDSPVEDDGLGVNGWIETTMDSFGDMTTFEPFMHDKVQLFVGDVVSKGKALETADHTIMRRSSVVKSTNELGESVEYTIGHAMVAISGKIWDFVGVIDDPMVAVTEGFDKWSDDECPLAHEIRGQDIPATRSYAISESNSMLLSIQMATSSLQSHGVVTGTGLMKQMTGANEMIEKGKYCDVPTSY
jgi:hypothetical protein